MFNASIIVSCNGVAILKHGSYGVFVDATGRTLLCSEHSASLDPKGAVDWLQRRYPHLSFALVMDDGAQYRADLHADLFGEGTTDVI